MLRSQFRPPRLGGQPRVVLENLPGWEAPTSWQPEHLKAAVGDREVAVRETHGPPQNMFQNLASGGRIAFNDYLDWVLETASDLREIADAHSRPEAITAAVCEAGFESSYYLDAKLDQLSAALHAETPMPDWYPWAPLDVNFWCGVLGTSSGLHCDITPNCNMQVVGQKHFSLFAPSQSRRLYRIPQVTHCRFDPNTPDFQRWPRARAARGMQCTLRPGQALYIPAGWYHQVTVVSGWAVNVNVFWRRPRGQALLLPGLWRFLLRRQWVSSRMALAARRDALRLSRPSIRNRQSVDEV